MKWKVYKVIGDARPSLFAECDSKREAEKGEE